jgi:imidazolonepropionase-like amidohydrolase
MTTRALALTPVVVLLALGAATKADAPHVYAITNARIVTVAGPPIAVGTVVVRSGRIEAVGASAVPPPDAQVIDATGLTVYPGLLDMGRTDVVDVPAVPEPRPMRTREELDRYWRSVILRPEVLASSYVKVDGPDLSKLASTGITTVLAAPSGEGVRGQSALVNVMAREEDPQIGDVASPRRGQVVLNGTVALHVTFSSGPSRLHAYPESLMGNIAFVRQAFLDAQHYALEQAYYGRMKGRAERPADDPSLRAMQPAVDGRLPVAFEAQAEREIRRALKMAAELKLDAIITGARDAHTVVAELKAQNARVVVSVNFPTKPSSLSPDADEPLATLRARADAPKTPAALEQGGVLFAFASAGLKEPGDLVKNVGRAVKAGLAADAAVRALTLNAARIAGVGDRLGSIEVAKIANLIVTDGDLFGEKTAVRHVFIDGRPIKLDPPAIPPTKRPAAGQQ